MQTYPMIPNAYYFENGTRRIYRFLSKSADIVEMIDTTNNQKVSVVEAKLSLNKIKPADNNKVVEIKVDNLDPNALVEILKQESSFQSVDMSKIVPLGTNITIVYDVLPDCIRIYSFTSYKFLQYIAKLIIHHLKMNNYDTRL